MHPLLKKLADSVRRTISHAEGVAAEVLRDESLFPVLVESLRNDDPVIRMRGADVMERVTRERPEWLAPYKDFLIRETETATLWQVRRHLAQMLPRLPLQGPEVRHAADLMLAYTNDRSSIVKTLAMHALFDLAERHPHLRQEALNNIRELMVIGTPAMKARGRMLLKAWNEKP